MVVRLNHSLFFLFPLLSTSCGSPAELTDATAPSSETRRDDSASQAPVAAIAPTAPPCPEDMQYVETDFCSDMERRCLDMEHERTNHLDICHAFAREQHCHGQQRRIAFCVDTYEYPNRPGAHPVWMLDWFQAQATCESKGKRLCWASEWTAACEGPDHTPFPYGFERDHRACNVDNFYIDPMRPGPRAQFFFYSKDKDVAFRELSRLDQSVPSGSIDRCRSGFGVYDMTGNLDEWVVSDEPTHDKSKWAGLKGGGWGHVRSQCRPMTTSHEPEFYYYFVGFRCCRDADGAPTWTPSTDATAAPAVDPRDFAPDPILPVDAPGPSKTKFTWVPKLPPPHPRPRRLRPRRRRGRLNGGCASGSRAPRTDEVNTSQLWLPIDEFFARPQAPRIPRQRRIFCNRNLRMSTIAWVGFDMDYTLAVYDQEQMDELSIRATIDKLISRGYPEFVRSIPYQTAFPVRGLLIDKRFGHILKMNRYKFVTKGYHGMRELAKHELRQLYHSKKIRPATPRYHWIDTLYALSEAALYAALVDAMEMRGLSIDYAKTFNDIRDSIDEAHRDGTILETVAADFPRFVRRDPELAPTLHKLRSAGKKLFLLTNSRWAYTDKMMSYLLSGAMTEYPHWRNYFDVVIVAATKPAFFQEKRPLMMHSGDELVPADIPLERGKIYEGGNLQDLERALGTVGDEVLYVGDHIYGDILRSKKESAWRTAMIIQELEGEVLAHDSCHEDFARSVELESARDRFEDELRFYQGRFKDLSRRNEQQSSASGGSNGRQPANGDSERTRVKRSIDRVRARLRSVDAELHTIERRIDLRFHPFWGSLLKEENEQSCFGSQVEDYACLYTSRVSNFLLYSPQQYFRSPRDEMAHEMAGHDEHAFSNGGNGALAED